MAKTIPTYEPKQLVIGSSWAWDVTYGDFPADESWELSYDLRGPDDFDLAWGTHVSAGDGAEFEVRVTAAQSAGGVTTPGTYRLVGRVNKSGDTWDGEIVYNAHLLVLADPSTAVKAKSFNRKMLEKIDAALLDSAASSAGVRKVEINGRTIEYRDTADLTRMRAHYAMLVAVEENPYGSVVQEVEFVRG